MNWASTPASIALIVVFIGCFGALALNLVHRLAAVGIGAFACILVGTLLGFYTPADAATFLGGKADTLILLGGVGLVTGVLAESGFFSRLARSAVEESGGSSKKIVISLCVATFVLSCFVNNLATILVVVPLSLIVADAMKIDPQPLVLGEVVASNLGGASTMIGDFPNMLIATEVGLPFREFLVYLAPVCLVQLAILIVYLSRELPDRQQDPKAFRALLDRIAKQPWDASTAFRGILMLAGMIVAFAVGSEHGISPALVAGVGGLVALVFSGVPPNLLLKRLHLGDILFFACLFLMVGAVDASGLLNGFGRSLADLSSRSPLVGALAVAWGAAFVTSILNAGPTTALLVHILLAALTPRAASEATWWALSLGVCAGSSATLTGATAGPVTASLMEQHGRRLTFGAFAGTGVPLALLFLLVTSGYLVLLTSWGG